MNEQYLKAIESAKEGYYKFVGENNGIPPHKAKFNSKTELMLKSGPEVVCSIKDKNMTIALCGTPIEIDENIEDGKVKFE
jgi:hypothetical protein